MNLRIFPNVCVSTEHFCCSILLIIFLHMQYLWIIFAVCLKRIVKTLLSPQKGNAKQQVFGGFIRDGGCS